MPKKLVGKVALATGGSSGLGLAAVRPNLILNPLYICRHLFLETNNGLHK
jgi:hypothetical protein